MGGGCLCGAVRYAIEGTPRLAGYCCCKDCRRVSGTGVMPFMVVPAGQCRITGAVRQMRSPCIRGTDAVRNFCAACGSLVFGGVIGLDQSHTVYAGSLDDPAGFAPTIAIFARDRPDWVILPEGLRLTEPSG